MQDLTATIYEFGGFRVDSQERLLFDGIKTVTLAPKVFDTLLLLLKNPGRALGKEEMLEQIWADSFVEENNLAQNISILRKVLGEGKNGAKYIETVSKRGYRFVAPVSVVEDEKTASSNFGQKRSTLNYNEEIQKGDSSGAENLQSNAPKNSLPPPAGFVSSAHKPETHYVRNGDVNIAYQVVGSGDLDIVFVMGWVSHLEYFWEEPHFAAFLNRLASFSRLILFDKRGTGLSDRVAIKDLPTLEQRMDDVRCVMDAVKSERAALVGVSEGGPMCSLFAATYPEKTAALVMIGTYAKRIREDDYPWGVTLADRRKFFEMMQNDWGKPIGIEERAPSLANDEDFRNWWATYLRMGASPGAAVALTKMNAEIDVRNVLPTIRVPSLVIHRSGDTCLKVEEGRFVASKIPACKYVELGGIDHLPFIGNQDEILDEIEDFLTGVRYAGEHDRVLATVMNVLIINPQSEAEKRGVRDWNNLLERMQIFVRHQLGLFKGRQVSYGESGVLATFDGPAKAIRCACAITDLAVRLNIRVKTGLHTGECDVVGENYSGFAVKLAEKIAEESAAGEILVSRTVKDLVAGSGILFEEHGVKTLGNAPDEWRLFSVKK